MLRLDGIFDVAEVLDGKEVPESLKSFLRNWKSAKDRQRKLLIDQAMTDAIPGTAYSCRKYWTLNNPKIQWTEKNHKN